MAEDVILHEPGSDAYVAATSPENSSAHQRPAFVAAPRTAAEVAAAVRECGRRGLRAVPQSTGHGAGGQLADDSVVIDTSGLDALVVDAGARAATAGAGLTWARVNAEAERHGLLGLAGSAPTVGIAGYTFGGGIGWLSRPHGMAAGLLRSVEYVDGHGELRRAGDDADDELDREAIQAFRGGGGVGVATALEFGLVQVPEPFAGYLLWRVEHLDAVVAAWAAAMAEVGDDVATSIAVLHLPPAPPFPEHLRGTPVVHLALAAGNGQEGAAPLLQRVRGAATPEVDECHAADAAWLAQIHLDPPSGVPALGDARWLGERAPEVAAAALSVAAPAGSPIAMLEVRSVGNDATGLPGAQSSVPAPYLVHAVGALSDDDGSRAGIALAFTELRAAVSVADAGRSAGSWMEGATSVPDALPAPVREQVAATAERVDPDGVLARSRFIS